jgi:hypothetical protein
VGGDEPTVIVPIDPPELTPQAARVLLQILIDAQRPADGPGSNRPGDELSE